MKLLFDRIKLIFIGLFITFGLVAFIFSTELGWFWLAALGDFILIGGMTLMVGSFLDKPWITFEKEQYQFLSASVPMMLSGWFYDCAHDWEYGFLKSEIDRMELINSNGSYLSGNYLVASKGKNPMPLEDKSESVSFSMSYVEYGDFGHDEHTHNQKSNEHLFCGCIYDFDYFRDDSYGLYIVGNNFFYLHPSITKKSEKRYDSFRAYAESADTIEAYMTSETEDTIRALFHKYEGRLLISIQGRHLYVAIQDEKDPFEVDYKLHWRKTSPDQSSVQIKKEGIKDNFKKMSQLIEDILGVFYSPKDVEAMNSSKGNRRIPNENEFLEGIRKEMRTNHRKRTATYIFVFILFYVGMLGAYFASVNR